MPLGGGSTGGARVNRGVLETEDGCRANQAVVQSMSQSCLSPETEPTRPRRGHGGLIFDTPSRPLHRRIAGLHRRLATMQAVGSRAALAPAPVAARPFAARQPAPAGRAAALRVECASLRERAAQVATTVALTLSLAAGGAPGGGGRGAAVLFLLLLMLHCSLYLRVIGSLTTIRHRPRSTPQPRRGWRA